MTARRVVEIRVHGVSGTPPEDTLGGPVTQVAGDDLSRVFRPAGSAAEPDGEQPHLVEAFHWGRHTSGGWRQGLWFLLLPLGMINVAQFMLPWPQGKRGYVPHALTGAALRLLGLVATLLFTASAAVVLIDLLAFQWILGSPPPSGQPLSTAQRLAEWGDRWIGVAAVVAAAAVILGFASLGRRRHVQGMAPEAPENGVASSSQLARPEFYLGDPDAPALTQLHLGGAASLIALVAFGLVAPADRTWTVAMTATASVLGAITVVVILLGDPEGSARTREGAPSALRRKLTAVVGRLGLGAGVAAFVAAIVVLLAATKPFPGGRHDPDGSRGLAVSGYVAQGLLAAGAVALLGIALGTACLAIRTRYGLQAEPQRPPRAFRRFLWGQAAPVVASIATFIGAGLTALVTYGVQAFLNRVASPDTGAGDTAEPFEVPRVLQRIAYAWGLTVVLLIAVAVGLAVWFAVRAHQLRDDVTRQYAVVAAGPGVDPGSLPDGAWQQRIAAAMALARVKNLLPGLLTLFTVVGWALYAAMLVEEADATLATTPPSCDEGPLGWLSGFPQDRTGCRGASWVTWLGTALLLGLATRLVVLGRSAARSPEERRKTNVVWDVIAFWPRSVQPFTPWPYSQRVVADLAARVRHHLAAPDRPSVVLAAHSQGSLVSVAALLWLHPTERARMGFVTYGSQLRLQFSRAFPAFVDYGVLTGLWTALGKRWRSLYRDTDPIGGPALSWDHVWDAAGQPSSSTFEHPTGAPDGLSTETGVRTCGPEWRLLDPEPPPGRDLQLGPFATFGKHSGYYDDPAFGRAVEQVVPEEGEPTPIPFPEPVAVGIALAGSWLLGWWTGRARRVSRGRAAPPAGG